jgi:ribokinase
MADYSSPRFLIFGKLTRDFYILQDGKVGLDVPGGNTLYAAVGLAIWEPTPPPGLVARVGENYPVQWLNEFRQRGMDVRGIRILPEGLDVRNFYAFADPAIRLQDDPVPYFTSLGIPFPRELLGYRLPKSQVDSRTQLSPVSIRQADLIPDFLDASAAHLCPIDYLTQTLIPAVLRQNGFTTITLDPSPGMMTSVFWDDIPAVLTGLTAFLPSEQEIQALFLGRETDIWQMAEALTAYGCEFVIIKRGEAGQYLFDSTTHSRWEVPSYPSRLVNPTGAGDAFCGGFLAGYRQTFDPLQAVLYGNISASLVVEGTGPFYALDALPRLAQARMDALKESVRRI